MIPKTLLTIPLLLAVARGIKIPSTPPDFTPESCVSLGVYYGNATSSLVPGTHLAQAQTASPPTQIALQKSISDTTRYLTLLVDPDVVYMGESTPFLHWMAQDLVASTGSSSSSSSSSSYGLRGRGRAGGRGEREMRIPGNYRRDKLSFRVPLTNLTANAGDYVPPGPQPGDTHRYVFLTFAQPEDFALSPDDEDFNADFPWSRLGFDASAFVERHVLGDPVAANWFTVTAGI